MSFWNYGGWWSIASSWLENIDLLSVNGFKFQDLRYVLYSTIFMFAIRYATEKYVFKPIGRYFGLAPKVIKIQENPVLEKVFATNKKLDNKKVRGLAKRLDWSERQIQRWIRKRSFYDKPSSLDKFAESGWRFTLHSILILFELHILGDKPCLWDSRPCTRDYPRHILTEDIRLFYMLALGYYVSNVFTHFWDARRKDFMQMLLHHVVTVALLVSSYTLNVFLFGTLIMLIHDLADVPMAAGKMTKYLKKHQLTNVILAIFAVIWMVTRVIIFPYRILFFLMTTPFDPVLPGYCILVSFLWALQLLHVYWTSLLIKIVIEALTLKPEEIKDTRSDSEGGDYISSSDEDDSHKVSDNLHLKR